MRNLNCLQCRSFHILSCRTLLLRCLHSDIDFCCPLGNQWNALDGAGPGPDSNRPGCILGRPWLPIPGRLLNGPVDDGRHPCKHGAIHEVLDRYWSGGGTRFSFDHNCCLIAGPPLFGRWAAPVNLIGAAEPESLQRPLSVKGMSRHVPANAGINRMMSEPRRCISYCNINIYIFD